MSLVVIGASGLVGGAVVRTASHAGRMVEVTSRTDSDSDRQLDLSDAASVRRVIAARARSADAIVLTAALSSVAACEGDPASSYEVNVEGTRAVVDAAAIVGAKLVFVSSDYVFGDGGPHNEDDEPVPMNEYGRQKLKAERLVLEQPSGLVVRTCQVFGRDARRANFVLSTVDRLAAGETVRARSDLFGTPTYVRDLAREIIALATGPETGVWHVAGPDELSRFDLAQLTARAFALDQSLILESRDPTDEVPRPLRAGLRSARGRPMLGSVHAGLAQLALEERSARLGSL